MFDGRLPYRPDALSEAHRLLVALEFWPVGARTREYALLDTASEWSVLQHRLLARLGQAPGPGDPSTALRTRFGRIGGRLCRRQIRLVPHQGEPLLLELTAFVSPEWPGPNVLGWKGGLERIKLALDPATESFYFGSL